MNRTSGSMNRDDYWAWLDDLRVGDDVMLYWTGGSFGHFKGMAKLVRVNPKSVAGALLEPVATETHGGGYPEGYIIVVPRSPTDRRFSEFSNAPMPISVNRIERLSGEKESSMNKEADIADRIAKNIMSVGPWSPAVMKTWTDYVAEPLRIAHRDIFDTAKNLEALAKMRGEPSEQMLRTIDRMQELLDEAVEYSGKIKTRLYEAREHVAGHLM